MSDEILELTEKLLHYNEQFLKIYREGRETELTHDFYNEIKPFADEVKEINDKWNRAMKKWLPTANTLHLHLKQIDTTSAHIEQISVQSFFPETSKSRFLNTQRSVEFVLAEVIKEVKNRKRCR
ncbi:YppE family protein [Neobacillus vireti]|uniref:YppE family protein n=1 Tax=Neobacillus vireti TaxID=220686 RepID=UPI0030009A21